MAPSLRWLTVGMVALIVIAAFESLAVTTVMPGIAAELDGEELFALAFAVPFAAGVVGMVVIGNWTDRRGPVVPLIVAGSVFAVGLVIAGLAPTMEVFVLGRLVHGLGGAAVTVPIYVIVARVYPPTLHPRIFAAFAAAWVVPSIIGPAIAGAIADAEGIGWRWVFLGVLVITVPAAFLMAAPLFRARDAVAGDPSVPWSRSRFGWALVAAVAALGVSLSEELAAPWRWVVALASIALVVVAARPLLPAGALRVARGLPAAVVLRMLVAGAFFATELYLPYLLQSEYELTPALSGVVLTGAGISWAAGSWLQGRLGARLTNARAVAIGTATLLAALVAVLATAAFALPVWCAFAAWTVAGAGMGLMYPRFTVSVLELSPVSAQGFNSSALTIGESLGVSVSISVTALVAGALAFDAFTAEFAVTVLVALVALLLAARMRPAASASDRG
ncbi:MFS transporter [Agromyces sp. MMS17-SY077]|uniref:MFS transporter n=2 Tax=Agromyces seonyuensis TaxID=2662446 RepID=A0A6I4NU58_9MICO|nr:MFS transporter [Agromyces seonyuensis]MWB97631.1 MFS transporter [Agromyces seonyuensis]